MRKETTLDKIDNYFETKSDSEANMYMLMAFLVVAGILMLLFFTKSRDYQIDQETKLTQATTSLAQANKKLDDLCEHTGDHEFQIRKKNKELQDLKAELVKRQNLNAYLDTKLRESTSVTYNQERWATFLDSLSKNAEVDNVKILSIDSEQKNIDSNEPQEVLNITLDIEGRFNNILKYINDIEESVVVVDVKGLDVNITNADDKKIGGKLKVSVWGMEYK